MSFFHFLFGETKPTRILLAVVLLVAACFFLPNEYEKEMPTGFQLIYFLLILSILMVAGFIFSSIEAKNFSLIRTSPVFDQASSAVIALIVLLLPIYFFRPQLLSLAILVFVVEFGLVLGKYIYIQFFHQK
jgi:hypothetical protein